MAQMAQMALLTPRLDHFDARDVASRFGARCGERAWQATSWQSSVANRSNVACVVKVDDSAVETVAEARPAVTRNVLGARPSSISRNGSQW